MNCHFKLKKKKRKKAKKEILINLYIYKWNLTSDLKVKGAAIEFVLVRYFTAIVPCIVFLSFDDMHLKCMNLKSKHSCWLMWRMHLQEAEVKT